MIRLVLLLVVACSGSPQPQPPAPEPPTAKRAEPAEQRTVRKQHEPFSLEVLGLQLLGNTTPALTSVATRMTAMLRAAAREDGAIKLGHQNKELIDEVMMANCANVQKACITTIAKNLGADQILYGSCEERGPVFHISLTLLDARSGIELKWTGTVQDSDANLQDAAKTAFAALVDRVF